jgi:hypothetical protein
MTLLLAPQDATRLVCLFLNNRLTFAAIHRRLAGLLTKVSCSHSGTLSRPQLNAPPISLRIRKDPSTRSTHAVATRRVQPVRSGPAESDRKTSRRWIPCPVRSYRSDGSRREGTGWRRCRRACYQGRPRTVRAWGGGSSSRAECSLPAEWPSSASR